MVRSGREDRRKTLPRTSPTTRPNTSQHVGAIPILLSVPSSIHLSTLFLSSSFILHHPLRTFYFLLYQFKFRFRLLCCVIASKSPTKLGTKKDGNNYPLRMGIKKEGRAKGFAFQVDIALIRSLLSVIKYSGLQGIVKNQEAQNVLDSKHANKI